MLACRAHACNAVPFDIQLQHPAGGSHNTPCMLLRTAGDEPSLQRASTSAAMATLQSAMAAGGSHGHSSSQGISTSTSVATTQAAGSTGVRSSAGSAPPTAVGGVSSLGVTPKSPTLAQRLAALEETEETSWSEAVPLQALEDAVRLSLDGGHAAGTAAAATGKIEQQAKQQRQPLQAAGGSGAPGRPSGLQDDLLLESGSERDTTGQEGGGPSKLFGSTASGSASASAHASAGTRSQTTSVFVPSFGEGFAGSVRLRRGSSSAAASAAALMGAGAGVDSLTPRARQALPTVFALPEHQLQQQEPGRGRAVERSMMALPVTGAGGTLDMVPRASSNSRTYRRGGSSNLHVVTTAQGPEEEDDDEAGPAGDSGPSVLGTPDWPALLASTAPTDSKGEPLSPSQLVPGVLGAKAPVVPKAGGGLAERLAAARVNAAPGSPRGKSISLGELDRGQAGPSSDPVPHPAPRQGRSEAEVGGEGAEGAPHPPGTRRAASFGHAASPADQSMQGSGAPGVASTGALQGVGPYQRLSVPLQPQAQAQAALQGGPMGKVGSTGNLAQLGGASWHGQRSNSGKLTRSQSVMDRTGILHARLVAGSHSGSTVNVPVLGGMGGSTGGLVHGPVVFAGGSTAPGVPGHPGGWPSVGSAGGPGALAHSTTSSSAQAFGSSSGWGRNAHSTAHGGATTNGVNAMHMDSMGHIPAFASSGGSFLLGSGLHGPPAVPAAAAVVPLGVSGPVAPPPDLASGGSTLINFLRERGPRTSALMGLTARSKCRSFGCEAGRVCVLLGHAHMMSAWGL